MASIEPLLDVERNKEVEAHTHDLEGDDKLTSMNIRLRISQKCRKSLPKGTGSAGPKLRYKRGTGICITTAEPKPTMQALSSVASIECNNGRGWVYYSSTSWIVSPF
jgi:hypothetical protein